MTDRPLVSFVLLAYNQERFIREAVEGAFAQTYAPMEIILSDDSSTDRTFEIMSEMADKYTGRNLVVLNQNSTNLGIGAHVNRALEMATGKLFVFAAGDDISLPHRVQRMFDFWQELGRPSGSLYSNVKCIDEHGRPLNGGLNTAVYAKSIDKLISRRRTAIAGCSHVMHRDVYREFGPLDP